MTFPELIRLVDVCILRLLQFCNFDMYILRHFSACSESCLYEKLILGMKTIRNFGASFSCKIRAKTSRNIVQIKQALFLELIMVQKSFVGR